MMPRFTPFRVIFSLVAGYLCLLGCWLALPSPSYIDPNDIYSYHTSVLSKGDVLTTVYERSWLRTTQVQPYLGLSSDQRRAYAIDWWLTADCKNGSITLHVSDEGQVDLTGLGSWTTSPPDAQSLTIQAKGGDDDGANPPWFAYADAILLYWDIHRDDIVRASTQASSPTPGTVVVGWMGRPLATISGIPSDVHDTREKKCDFTSIKVSEMSEFVPSKTFWIRHYIIMVLAPLTLMIVTIAGPLSTICFAIAYVGTVCLVVYCITMWVCWAVFGFQLWPEWRTQNIMRRGFRRSTKRSVWGPAGPLPEAEDGEDYAEAQHDYNGAVPLASIGAFFKSKSPLDDLLVTFEATRWMVEPLRRPARHPQRDSFDVENIIPAPEKAKITINGRT